MIETKTTWKDSGYDCDHCGGQILKRSDHEAGHPAQICYQCQVCGCQWELSGDILRVGHLTVCYRALKSQATTPVNPGRFWLAFVIVILVLLGVIYFGGLVAVRYVIPIAITVFVFRALYLMGKERMWW